MNYYGIEPLLNTTDGMTVLRNNTKNDDGTDEIESAAWFSYLGNAVNKIYANGNSWIGFSTSGSQDLKICNRDGAMYSLYSQQGTIYNVYKFIKIRWEGYTQYNSTSDDRKLVYEVFILSNDLMFINVITAPSSSYIGISSIRSAEGNTSLSITPASTTTIKIDWTNNDCIVTYEKFHIDKPFAAKYLVEQSNKLYSQSNNELKEIPSVVLSKETFLQYGCDNLNYNLIKALKNPKVHLFHDSEDYMPILNLKINALPFDQRIFTKDYDISYAYILGISSIMLDCDEGVKFAFSFDSGITYKKYVSGWIDVDDEYDGMIKKDIESLTMEQMMPMKEAGKYMFRFVLSDLQYVNSIKFIYKMEGNE